MRWNDDCILLTKNGSILDELLQEKLTYDGLEVSCNKRSLTRSEFYFASQSNLRPSMILEVHSFEYDGQSLLEYDGQRYKVIKTFEKGDVVELTCEEVADGTRFSK